VAVTKRIEGNPAYSSSSNGTDIDPSTRTPIPIPIPTPTPTTPPSTGLSAVYEKWPEYFRDASKIACCLLDHDTEFYRSVIFAGMGGSATSCDILNDLMYSTSRIPSASLTGHDVPAFVGKHSLVIINSVSGDTEEALSMTKAATAKGAEVICISSGGKLKELSASCGAKHVNIPKLLMPRASLPYLVMPGLRLIGPLLDSPSVPTKDNSNTDSVAAKDSIISSILSSVYESLERTRNLISFDLPEDQNVAKKISHFIKGGLPFCFTSPALFSAGNRFKNSLNENAKLFCFRESLLEASHNEIVPFTFNYDTECRVVFLRWSEGDDRIVKQRFEKVKGLFREIGQPSLEVNIAEPYLLGAILSSIYILDYSTIYMALSRKLDPSPTPAIEILKKIEPAQG
jgi:glucose/mannose-6-phosphate isomerase